MYRHAQSLLIKTGFLFIFLISSLLVFAQTSTVQGTVRDANGLPLAGASVVLEGTRRGTVTDANGNFSIIAPPGSYNLVISYVGFTTQKNAIEVPAGGLNNLSYGMQNAGDLNRIVVVGSRSTQVRSATQTPVPVDVITSRDLQATGQVEPTQMLNFVAPSYNSSRQTIADGTDHIDPATLRGLGPDQVLVLVNGRRRYNQALLNVNGTIGRGSVGTDMNSIVPAAIERIEVLRDGASSQYGSDAIGGVVNVVLKKQSRGTTVYSHFGQHYRGDGETQQVGLTHGMKLGKEGFITISGEVRHRNATNRAGVYTGRVYTTNVAQDEQLIAERGFDRRNNMYIGNSEIYNKGVIVNAGAPVSANTRVFLTGALNWRNGKAYGFYRYPFQTTQVNAALYPDGFLPQIASTVLDRSVIFGLEGRIGNAWNWDMSQTSGGNSFAFQINNTNNASQFAQGRNAQTEFYAGKLRFNQHTTNLNLAKDFGSKLGLKSFNVGIGGELRFDNYQIEAGEEGSYKNYDPASGRAGGAQVFPGFQPANAVDEWRTVTGAYLDIESDLTDKFLANVAARYEHYSDFGSNVAGKLALRYKVMEALSFRGSVSNGFRAPSMHQRYFSAISTVFVNTTSGFVPLQQGTFRNNSDIANAFGIPSLKAEKSMNYSVGLTSRPGNNWSVTVDAYQINIDDRIVLTGSFTRASSPVVNNILSAYPDVTSAIFITNAINTRTRGLDVVIGRSNKLGVGTLDITLAGNVNETKVVGDVKSSDVLKSDPNLANGVLFNIEERGRIERAQPKNKFALTANYRNGRFGAVIRATRFGKVATIFNGTDRSRDEFFDPKVVTDASLSYRLFNFLNLTVGANNIGDVYPDKLKNFANTSDGRFVYSRNATQFGFNGGYYYTALALDLHNIKFAKKIRAVPAAPVAAVVEAKPLDTDGDGLADNNDACPTEAGSASMQGCPDKDGDGIADKDDRCPEVAGARIFNGCPDRDGDGVEDSKDNCPDVAGPVSNNGCPEQQVAATIQAEVDKSARQLYFELNSAKLKVESDPALDLMARILKDDPKLMVDIEGHTDNTGSSAYNLKLSRDRAASVKAGLVQRGVEDNRIDSKGFGESQPVAENKTADGRAQNRRVVVKLRY
jgi:iron complex outermembrane receptor protein